MLRTAALMTLLLLALAGSAATSAFAEVGKTLAPAEEILTALRARGYRILEDERTWLGRQRIVAGKNGALREVVFNPGTGEILRDYSFLVDPGGGSRDLTAASAGSGNTGVAGGFADEPGLSVTTSMGSAVVGESGDPDVRAPR